MNKIADPYSFVQSMAQLYSRLQDDRSKQIFWARLQFDIEPTWSRAMKLGAFHDASIWVKYQEWMEQLRQVAGQGKKIVLYGAGKSGGLCAEWMLSENVDFYAFCDKNKAVGGGTLQERRVLSPKELLSHSEQYAVMITTSDYYEEILQFLTENGFPKDSILKCSELSRIWLNERSPNQYYDFPELFQRGTAIVDAGCLDGKDTIGFYHLFQGEYSRIYAFEPDETSYERCKTNIEAAGIPNVEIIQAGLSDAAGEAVFACSGDGVSYLTRTDAVKKYNVSFRPKEAPLVRVRTLRLDDVADTRIGLIKMDIEGGEFDALQGAREVIRRDKPMMAICIYHRQGDMLAIMDYLHQLAPEYRFWIRQYSSFGYETVLFAAI